MNREGFEAMVKNDIEIVTRAIKQASSAADRDWDIVDPMFYGFRLGDEGEVLRGLFDFSPAKLSKDEAMEAFRLGLQAVGAAAGGILCGGYKLDPDTRERVGEMILLTIEDDDDHCAHAKWDLTRNESGPVTLGEVEFHISDNASEDAGGRMQGFFPRKPQKQKLN